MAFLLDNIFLLNFLFLQEHTSVHTGEVLYTCPNCPMTFFSSANMYKHRQRLHKAEYALEKKTPLATNIMKRAKGATQAMKQQLAMGANTAFFNKRRKIDETDTSERQQLMEHMPMIN